MDEKLIRNKIHRAVDVHGASMQDDPHLAQRIITQTNRKEVPRMKKLSTGMIIAIALMLLSATAVAVGLTVEEMWRQSFAKMNTTGIIRNYGEPGEDELSTEEAIALARKVIQETYGTPDEELDSMGLYPTFHPREVDDGTEYPSEWKIYYSSRTGVDLDYDDTEHGPLGEYRVYINAETGEITYRHWYTNDFWPKAQQVWDCGSYDEVYWEYTRTEFFDQSAEDQRYWTAKLAEKGYAVVTEEESLRKALLSAQLELQFCELSRIADNTAPQVAAAWQTLEESTGMKAEPLQKYAYVATLPDWQTGTDNVCIHFSYELQWDMSDKGYLNPYVNNMFSHINNLGLYMVSFDPGTTEVAAITHISPSEYGHEALYEADGLLAKVDWEPADLVTFDEAYTKLDRAVKRMRAWIQADGTYTVEAPIEVVADDFLLSIGGNPEFFEAARQKPMWRSGSRRNPSGMRTSSSRRSPTRNSPPSTGMTTASTPWS